MEQLSPADFMAQLDPTIVPAVVDKARLTNATALVLFRSADFHQLMTGNIFEQVLCVGPDCTYKGAEELKDSPLGDMPSSQMWPRNYCVLATPGVAPDELSLAVTRVFMTIGIARTKRLHYRNTGLLAMNFPEPHMLDAHLLADGFTQEEINTYRSVSPEAIEQRLQEAKAAGDAAVKG